jgi:hypothetical protein
MLMTLAAINIVLAGYALDDIIVPTNSEPTWRVWIRFVLYLSMSIYFIIAMIGLV